jgi:hypothetical protein
MLEHGERRVKARHEITQFYERGRLPRGDIIISGDPDPNANNSLDDDAENETYLPSPRTRPHGKGLASASGSEAARDEEIEEEIEEEGDADDEEEEETFEVEEINPTSYIHMGTPIFWLTLNPDWMEKISYKGKIDLVREKRKENPRLVEKETIIDYRFHTVFQQDFYESVIISKTKPMTISQWIDWNYMEGKGDRIFIEVVTTCRAKHLKDVMAFRKNWNNEIIAQFFATLYVEERGTQEGSIGLPREGGM